MSLAEGGEVCGGGEEPQLVCHKVPAGIFFWTCNVASVGVAVSTVGRSGGQILHGACGGGIFWILLPALVLNKEVITGLMKLLDLSTNCSGLGVPDPITTADG